MDIMSGHGRSKRILALLLLLVFVLGPTLQAVGDCHVHHGEGAADVGPSFMPPQDPKKAMKEPTYSVPPGPLSRTIQPRTTGTAKVLIIPVQFKDVAHWGGNNVSSLSNRTFSDDPSMLSLNDYLKECSGGKFNITGNVTPWVNSSYNMSYYGADGTYIDDLNGPIYRLVTEAVMLADSYVDFSKFDADKDGVVDHLIVVHAGQAQEGWGGGKNDIWSHHWAVLNTNLKVDGVQVYPYSMVSEYSPVGTWAHEFGHDLGLPDLYDIDGSSQGVGRWDVMGSGSWNGGGRYPAHYSAWSKTKLGWVSPIDIIGPMANMTMNSVEKGGPVYRLKIGDPANSKEYFLLENRQRIGFDQKLPGDGLLIWHVDDSQTSNTYDDHRLVDLEESDEASNGDTPSDIGDPWANSTEGFWTYSVPSANSYDGETSGWTVEKIGPSRPQMVLTVNIIANDVGVAFLDFNRYSQLKDVVYIDAHVFNFGTIDQTDVKVEAIVSQGSTVVYSFDKVVPFLKSKNGQVVRFNFTPSAQGNYLVSVRTLLPSDQVHDNDEAVEVLHVTTIIFQDDVEKGENGWVHTSSVPPSDIWSIIDDSGGASQVRSPHHAWFSGVKDLKGGNYIPHSEYYLQRTIDVRFVKTGYLAFDHREDLTLSIQNMSIPRSDTAYVEVRTNLDTTFSVLAHYNGTSGGWWTSVYDLTPYLNKVGVVNITVRFRLSTQFLGYNKGWWVDDIMVLGQWSPRDVTVLFNTTATSGKPSGTYTLGVTVWNSGSVSDTYTLKVYTAPFWVATLPTYEITVEPLKSKVLTLTFTISKKAMAGEQDAIQVEATSKDDATVSTKAQVMVTVQSVKGIEVSTTPWTTVMPGQEETFIVNVSNNGNGNETVHLALGGTFVSWANLTETNLTLGPFESRGVEVVVDVPPHMMAGKKADIQVLASTKGGLKASGDIRLVLGRSYGLHLVVLKEGPMVTPGGTAELSINLTNDGNDQDIFVIEYTIPLGWTIQGDTKASLGPWETTELMLIVEVPGTAPLGSFVIKVKASSPTGKVVDEAELSVNVVLPDPAVASMELSRTYLNAPGNVTITAVIENKGTGTIGEVLVSFYDGSHMFQTLMVDNLSKGQSRTVTVYRNFGAGHHDISVILTYEGPQADKTNDEAHDSLKVNKPSGFLPGFEAVVVVLVLVPVALVIRTRKRRT
jgi:immune inhibitor A